MLAVASPPTSALALEDFAVANLRSLGDVAAAIAFAQLLLQPPACTLKAPRVRLRTRADGEVIEVALDGIEHRDVRVHVRPGALRIETKRRLPCGHEDVVETFVQQCALPRDVVTTSVRATIRGHTTLEIFVPRGANVTANAQRPSIVIEELPSSSSQSVYPAEHAPRVISTLTPRVR
ncbi:Hypothetical protein UVM_LOCUS259 [uncultured virus]|nr:Hypothetical protein UVM_LOCUS259 [uncultured virus]